MSRKIIVTGGAGFIGSHIVAALNARGLEDIRVVDHLGGGEKWRNLVPLRYVEYWDKATFRDLVLADALDPVDVVFHMGACSATTERDADYLADNNYRYTRDLCGWCRRHGARFIYASSAATYGDGTRGYSDEDAATPELRPLNMYGYSKHLFDLWALREGALREIAGVKFFNVYGPGEAHKGDMRSVIHKAFGQIRATGQVGLFKSYRPDYADGEQVRDFVYVRDAARVCLWLMDHPDRSGLFNVGTGRSRSWNDLAKAVFAAMDRPVRIEYIDMPESLRAKYQYHTESQPAKLRAAGYPDEFTSLEQGVAEYVRALLADEP